jgi:outer membrane lipoprotein-sorting protein
MKLSRPLIPAVFALLLGAPGCLFHTRTVEVRLSNAKLQTATQEQLVNRLNQEAARIKTLNATVDIDSSVGGEKRGKITDFKEIRGYVLVRKPNMMRMIGLYPIVRNKAFDMVSDGHEFKLSIPATNKFYIGHNQAIKDSSNPLDTIRPQSIYDALLLQEVDPQNEVAVLESSNEMVFDAQTKKMVQQPNYILDVIRRTDKAWMLARKVVFDRTNLRPHRQITFDDQGNRVTEASYETFKDYDGIPFPGLIDIKRPQEEYDIRLIMVKLTLNQPISEDQFALQQPVGSELVNLDERNKNAGANPSDPAAKSTAGNSPATTSASPH